VLNEHHQNIVVYAPARHSIGNRDRRLPEKDAHSAHVLGRGGACCVDSAHSSISRAPANAYRKSSTYLATAAASFAA